MNGSFEDGTFSPDGNGAVALSPPSTAITGWTVISSQLAWITNSNSFGLSASDGDKLLDLTGYDDSSPYGGVEQSVATTIGDQYLLTFDLGNYGINTIAAIEASADASNQTFSAQNLAGGQEWYSQSFYFTATSASTLIQLLGITASNGGNYIGLDNVALTDLGPTGTPSVPEPGSLIVWSLVGGIFGVGGIRKRLKRATAA
jgi:hypothetical protein